MSAELNSMTIAELVALYNKHADKKIKSFKDKATAVKRVKALGIKSTAKKATRKTAAKDTEKRVPREDNFPLATGAKLLHKTQPGSLNGKIIAMCEDGTTIRKLANMFTKHDEELGVEYGNEENRVWAKIRILNVDLGYGFTKKGDTIKIVVPAS